MALALVRTTVGGSYNTPGPSAVAPGNAVGNLLLLFAAWDVSANATSGFGVIPAGGVGDSSRNWWRYAGDSGSAVPGCRVGVWVCSNALAITRWLSFMPQGYVTSFAYLVAEFSGAPANYWPLIDFSVPASSVNASALSTAGTATVADYVFGIGAAGSTAPAITQPTGFTVIGTATQGGANPNGVELTAAWLTTGAGAVAGNWTYSIAGMCAACNVGLTQASNLPVQINPNFPRVFVEAAFGQHPGDPTVAILDQQYTDISSYAIGPAGQVAISVAGGRTYELTQPEAGTITVGLNNQSGAFNPGNASSPFFPNVVPGVPVRVSAQFSGRRYPLKMGYVERWPQDWPDMPQWGWSTMVATDAVGVASSANLPSAVQGEIYADNPYLCFPFSEQYTSSSNTVNGPARVATECDGFPAINTAPANQQTATYIDGFSQPVVTGQSLGFLGDSSTGMGASGYSGIDTSGFRGPGAQYGPDTSMPQIQPSGTGDITFECWFSIPTATLPGSQQQIQLFQLVCPPYLGSNNAAAANFGGGVVFTAGITVPTALPIGIYAQGSWEASPVTLGNTTFGTLHHLLMIFSQGFVTFWVDGVNLGLVSGLPSSITPIGFAFGLCTYAFGAHGANANYSLAYATLYPYTLQPNRILNHYQSGNNGFAGDSQIQRAARYIAWGKLNLGLAGPTPADHVQLASAYSTASSPLASALNNDALSAGGNWFANECGNLVIIPRPANYDLASSITFGDNVAGGEVPYDPSSGFDYDNTYISNTVQAQLVQGPNSLNSAVVRNQASVNQYFQRGPLQQQISAEFPSDAADRANWSANKYAQPSLRVRTMVVNLASRPSAIAGVLSTGIGDPAVVNRRPLSQGSYSLPVTVGKVQHDIGPGSWKTTYQMYPNVPENAVLQTDTATFDVLGSNSLAW